MSRASRESGRCSRSSTQRREPSQKPCWRTTPRAPKLWRRLRNFRTVVDHDGARAAAPPAHAPQIASRVPHRSEAAGRGRGSGALDRCCRGDQRQDPQLALRGCSGTVAAPTDTMEALWRPLQRRKIAEDERKVKAESAEGRKASKEVVSTVVSCATFDERVLLNHVDCELPWRFSVLRSLSDALQILSFVDFDGDGLIAVDEFVSAFKRGAGRGSHHGLSPPQTPRQGLREGR